VLALKSNCCLQKREKTDSQKDRFLGSFASLHPHCHVTIVNLLGAEVARLFSGELGAGKYSFSWDAINAQAGMYECVVRAGGAMQRIPILHY
jgi:hypothetical protein